MDTEQPTDLSVGPGVVIQVGDPGRVEGGAAPDDAVHGVALVKQELSQIGTILSWGEYYSNIHWRSLSIITCDPSDKSHLPPTVSPIGFCPTMQIIFLHSL